MKTLVEVLDQDETAMCSVCGRILTRESGLVRWVNQRVECYHHNPPCNGLELIPVATLRQLVEALALDLNHGLEG